MQDLTDMFQSDDWKTEKHVPVIDIEGSPGTDERIKVRVTIGKEVPHPNKTDHHIGNVMVYFLPEGEKFPYQIGAFDLSAHGASTDGPDSSTVYTEPEVACTFMTERPGIVMVSSHCNIHGLWKNERILE